MQLRTKMVLQSTVGLAASSILLLGNIAFAQSVATPPSGGWGMHGGLGKGMGMRPGVIGVVASVNGNTLTVTSKGRPTTQGATPVQTTFTVDATSATVTKDNAASTVSAIAVGDTVMVQGTVTGTTVSATKIMYGLPLRGPRMGWGMGSSTTGQPNSIIKGNGQPVVGGSVTAVSGNTLTITTAQGSQTYAVDATNAIIDKDNATSSVSAIAIGDKVVVQGAVNGSSITAYSVMDSGSMPQSAMPNARRGGGFFGVIGGFFHRIFGFF